MSYKNIRAYSKGYIDVGEGHSIYYEQSGNKKGKPVLFVHGGPGGGCSNDDKRFFNPRVFHIITFDQRGSGKSKPFASIEKNTTFRLASDMRKLLKHLKIEKTFLFGGSWGSTLSLVYAIRFPETVSGMVIRGIFLPSKEEEEYFTHQAKNVFPDAWEKMARLVPVDRRRNVERYYYDRMLSGNEKTRKKYALEWARYEFSISKLVYSKDKVGKILKKVKYVAFSIIELHYLVNNCFMPSGYILKNAGKIKCPISIVHGRYDHVCMPLNAWELHRAMPNSKLFFTLAGHSASDKETEKTLVKEMDLLGKSSL